MEKIFKSGKTFEMRSSNTKIRGRIFLIESGSSTIVGECSILDSFELNEIDIGKHKDKHQVENLELLKKWRYAWILSDVVMYETPYYYKHPQGAVIWVNLKNLKLHK